MSWETIRYKNTPQNAHLVKRREGEGYEVYSENARFVRLRRQHEAPPEGPPDDVETTDDSHPDDSHPSNNEEE